MLVSKTPAPLRQQVVANLRAAITNGPFQPGERLVERTLCEATGVSRTVIREALRQLETEGLVEIVPNKGPRVAEIRPEDAADLYEVRAVLEELAARCFAKRATPAQRRKLRKHFDRFAAACDVGDTAKASRIKSDFYRALTEGSGNSVLALQIEQLLARISLLRAATLSHPGRLPRSRKEIGDLVEALERGDATRSARMARIHVENAAAVLDEVAAAAAREAKEEER